MAGPIIFSGTQYQWLYTSESKLRDLSKDPNYFNPNQPVKDLAATALHYATNQNYAMSFQVLVELASQDPLALKQLLPPDMLNLILVKVGLDQKTFDAAVKANRSK